jgi:hypothetical protein
MVDSSKSSGPVPDPDELARCLAGIEHRGQVAAAVSDAMSQTGMTQAWDLASVARAALREAARVGQLEAELSAAAGPAAVARLRMIADVTAVCLAAVVADTARAMLTDPWGNDNDGDAGR